MTFFRIDFPNSLIVLAGSSVFVCSMKIYFLSDFLEMVSPIHSFRFRSSLLFSQWTFFELYVRTCPAAFFVSSSYALFLFTFVHTAHLKVKLSE